MTRVISPWLAVGSCLLAVAYAGCREVSAFGHEGREGLKSWRGDEGTQPREISVALPYPADFTARCGERETDATGTTLTFFLDGDDAVPVFAPDAGTFHIVHDEGRTRYAILTVEHTIIYLDHLQYPRSGDGETVYRGEPLGIAGTNAYWSQSVGMKVVTQDPRTLVIILAQDAFDPSRNRLFPDEFECGVVDGRVYRSGNIGAVNFPRGTLIRDRWSETVYRVERDGVRREVRGSIESCEKISAVPLIVAAIPAFACLRQSYQPISADTICAEAGERPFGDGALVRIQGEEAPWVVDGGYLRPFSDHGTFLLAGYEEGAVREAAIESLQGVYVFALHLPWTASDFMQCATGEPFAEAPM